MADGQVTIAFSADISGLTRQIDEARAKLAQFTAQVNTVGAGSAGLTDLQANIKSTTAEIELLSGRLANLQTIQRSAILSEFNRDIKQAEKNAQLSKDNLRIYNVPEVRDLHTRDIEDLENAKAKKKQFLDEEKELERRAALTSESSAIETAGNIASIRAAAQARQEAIDAKAAESAAKAAAAQVQAEQKVASEVESRLNKTGAKSTAAFKAAEVEAEKSAAAQVAINQKVDAELEKTASKVGGKTAAASKAAGAEADVASMRAEAEAENAIVDGQRAIAAAKLDVQAIGAAAQADNAAWAAANVASLEAEHAAILANAKAELELSAAVVKKNAEIAGGSLGGVGGGGSHKKELLEGADAEALLAERTTNLQGKLTALEGILRSERAELARMSTAAAASGNAVEHMGTSLEPLGKQRQKVKDLESEVKSLSLSLGEGAKAATGHGSALAGSGASVGFYARELHATVDEALSGRFGQLQGTLANIAFTTLQASSALLTANPLITAMGAAAIVTVGTLSIFVVQALRAAAAVRDMNVAIAASGNVANFGGGQKLAETAVAAQTAATAIQTAWDVLSLGSALSNKDAGEIQGAIGSVVGASKELNDAFVQVARQAKIVFPKDFKDKIDEIIKGFGDLDKTLPELINKTNNLDPALRKEAEAALVSGDQHRKQAAALSIVIQQLQNASAQQIRALATQQSLTSSQKEYIEQLALTIQTGGAIDAILASNTLAYTRVGDQVQIVVRNLQKLKEAQEKLPTAQPASKSTVEDIGNRTLEKLNSPDTQIRKLETDLANLEAQLKPIDEELIRINATGGASLNGLSNNLEETKKKGADLGFAIATIKDNIRDLEDKKAGGSIVQKSELDIARQNVEMGKDDLRNAQEKQLILVKNRDLIQDAVAKAEAEKKVQEGIVEIERLRGQSLAAQARFAAERANKGSEEEKSAKINEVKAGLKGFSPNSTEAEEARTRILAINNQYDDQEEQRERNKSKARFDTVVTELEAESVEVRKNAQDHLISYEEEYTRLSAITAKKLALTKTYYADLIESYHRDVNAQSSAELQKIQAVNKYTKEQERVSKEVALHIYEDYKRSFEQIGSTVSSSIVSMIQGQSRLIDAVRSVALQIIQSFIQARVKSVADFAAGVAAKVSLTAQGQAAETGATVAGVAARKGVEEGGAAAGAAANIAKYFGQIQAAAAATYANVFAYMSPILGPLAVVPATAASALVIAQQALLPSFAVGAWNLPNDMVAQVHAGEMIVPAGPAAALRSSLSGGGSGSPSSSGSSGVGGGVTNIHFNVSAVDSQGVKKFLQNNAKHILGAMEHGVHNGSHLGLGRIASH